MTHRFELDEVAQTYLPAALKDPTRWLRRKLNAGELRGRRYGRHWTMSADDVAFMLAVVSNDKQVTAGPGPAAPEQEQAAVQPVSIVDGMSARSRRRLRRVQ